MVSLSTPHVIVGRGGVKLFCSAECMAAAQRGSPPAQARVAVPAPVHAAEPVTVVRKPALSTSRLFAIALGIGSLSPCNQVADLLPTQEVQATTASAMTSVVERPRVVGPAVPDDQERAMEFMGELAGDRWIHPLAGPERRMPIRSSRVFGAARHGDRPGECRSGHCGVDIGGEAWGEPIMAVHEGIVDRVKRVDEGNGGMYVRIAHRDGKVFSQYFHLAAIPRRLSEGDRVRAGQIIGLLGDTGVKESNPHLHFTISVKPSPTAREIYMDPEPLIALWPLKVPTANGGADAAWEPGVPLGAIGRARVDGRGQPLPRKADRKRGKKRRATASAGTSVAADQAALDAGEDETGDANPAEDAYESSARSSSSESPPARFPFGAQPAAGANP
jgi:murein DD-endopeptidase MepM/ murein hydrolase activator NlpD